MVVVEAIKLEREKIKVDMASMVDDVVDVFLRNYMKNNIFHAHYTESTSLLIPDLQQQLYLKMKDDKKA
ncbi:hypothetical protein Tco_0978970 [Tanacetum coccineum]|uniref:Uncharacterized protein n=1 Tax=Tanacetum coccineum TaxID=301880 RepID=A0ABQ5EPE5_9ASTR